MRNAALRNVNEFMDNEGSNVPVFFGHVSKKKMCSIACKSEA